MSIRPAIMITNHPAPAAVSATCVVKRNEDRHQAGTGAEGFM